MSYNYNGDFGSTVMNHGGMQQNQYGAPVFVPGQMYQQSQPMLNHGAQQYNYMMHSNSHHQHLMQESIQAQQVMPNRSNSQFNLNSQHNQVYQQHFVPEKTIPMQNQMMYQNAPVHNPVHQTFANNHFEQPTYNRPKEDIPVHQTPHTYGRETPVMFKQGDMSKMNEYNEMLNEVRKRLPEH